MVSDHDGRCVVSLPIETLDGRFVDVYIEFKAGGHVEVHDGGRSRSCTRKGSSDEPKRRHTFYEVADRLGTHIDREDTIRKMVHVSKMCEAILAVAQCASVAMHEVLYHKPAVQKMPVANMVRRTLTKWKTPDFDVHQKVPLKGASTRATHAFDYVAVSTLDAASCVAVQVLSTTYSPQVQTRVYGFRPRHQGYSVRQLATVTNAALWRRSRWNRSKNGLARWSR